MAGASCRQSSHSTHSQGKVRPLSFWRHSMIVKLQTSQRFVASSNNIDCSGVSPPSRRPLVLCLRSSRHPRPPPLGPAQSGLQAQFVTREEQLCLLRYTGIYLFIVVLGWGELISGLTSSSRHLKLQYFAFIELQHNMCKAQGFIRQNIS